MAETYNEDVIFWPIYLSIETLDPVNSFPLNENDLFTSNGVTIISEVVNGL